MAHRRNYHILICLIQIWKGDKKNPTEEPQSPLMIAEVEHIQIEESYRKLISEALVRFPRGTVIKQITTQENIDEHSSQVTAKIDDSGVLVTTRANSKLADVKDFEVGSRIRIRLGYLDPLEPQDMKIYYTMKPNENGRSIYNDAQMLADYRNKTTIMFDGYITKCSASTPIEIQCENLASVLKKISCPNVRASKNKTVNDFLADDGEYKLLKDSGLSLHPDTANTEINIGKVNLTTDLTVADVLTEWGKYKVYAFIKYNGDKPYIAVGRSYFSNPGKDSILNYNDNVKDIYFDYNVASDDLTLMHTDKLFLAVEATCLTKDNRFYHITVRKNPDYDSSKPGSKQYQVLNETKLSKKAMKLGATCLSKSKDKVDLSRYDVIPYMSRKIGISKEQLLEEAIKYFESYNMNGIEGSLTLFGDLALRTGTKVRLIDNRYKAKNGYYLVDEVITKFGTEGYRQTIKLPYCISKIKEEKNEGN